MIGNIAHDYRLVALSVLLATAAAYAALELAGTLTAARGWRRVLWLAGGSTAMGMGMVGGLRVPVWRRGVCRHPAHRGSGVFANAGRATTIQNQRTHGSADAALYRAKREGRDRAVIAEPAVLGMTFTDI